MKIIFILLLNICLLQGVALSDWSLYKSAQITNRDRIIFRIDNKSKSSITAWLIFRGKNNKFLMKELPVYSVDMGPIIVIANQKYVIDKKIRWIKWELDSDGIELERIMKGKKIIFQLYSPDGEIIETEFSLDGAGELISEVVN